MYDCDLTNIGLPSTGKHNGEILNNKWERLRYLQSLNDEQKIEFLDLLISNAYQSGIATGEENMLETID